MTCVLEHVEEVTPHYLLFSVSELQRLGNRFVTMTCMDEGDSLVILYHFDLNYHLQNLRLRLVKGAELPSISSVFFAAAIIENELKDHFGLNIVGMAIDFGGRFLLAEGAPVAPFLKGAARIEVVRKSEETPSAEGSPEGKPS